MFMSYKFSCLAVKFLSVKHAVDLSLHNSLHSHNALGRIVYPMYSHVSCTCGGTSE